MARGAMTILGLAACQFQRGSLPAEDASQIDAAIDVANDAPDLATGLVAWYQMDTLSNGLAPDATGNGHTGACASCPVVSPGRIAMAYSFSDDRIDVIADGGLASMTGLTVTFWMRLETNITDFVCPVN